MDGFQSSPQEEYDRLRKNGPKPNWAFYLSSAGFAGPILPLLTRPGLALGVAVSAAAVGGVVGMLMDDKIRERHQEKLAKLEALGAKPPAPGGLEDVLFDL